MPLKHRATSSQCPRVIDCYFPLSAYLIRKAEPLLKPSFVDDGKTGIGKPDPIRTSHGVAFVRYLEVQQINRGNAPATGTMGAHAKALYLMRYAPGQQYQPRFDALPGLRNQREWTAIFFLNECFERSATVFPERGFTVRGAPGNLLVFRNSD